MGANVKKEAKNMLIISADSTNLHVVDGSPLPSGSVTNPSVMFELDSFWEQYAVTAIFYGNGNTVHLANIVSGVKYTVPWECIAEPGVVKISLFGIKEGVLSTTVGTTVQVIDSGINESTLPQSPTPSAYQQYVNAVTELAEQAAESARLAEATVQNIQDIPEAISEAEYVLEHARTASASAEALLAYTNQIKDFVNSAKTKPTAVIDQNTGNFIYFWIGTKAEYNAQLADGKCFDDFYCIITDDSTIADVTELINEALSYIARCHSAPEHLDDALSIDESDPSADINRFKYSVSFESSNCPDVEDFSAIREPVDYLDENTPAVVTLTEVLPIYGRKWVNVYGNDHSTPSDNSWLGWKIMSTPTEY